MYPFVGFMTSAGVAIIAYLLSGKTCIAGTVYIRSQKIYSTIKCLEIDKIFYDKCLVHLIIQIWICLFFHTFRLLKSDIALAIQAEKNEHKNISATCNAATIIYIYILYVCLF